MRKWYPAVLIVSAFLFSAAVYPRLPDQMTTHWGLDEAPNGWSGRATGAFLLPIVLLVLWALLRWLPKLDPRRAHDEKFAATYDLVVNGLLTLLALTHVLVFGFALGWQVPVGRIAPPIFGAAVIALGFILPHVRPNQWIGIRVPWTLSSERVWRQSHRGAGYLFVGAGLAGVATIALPATWSIGVLIGAVFIAGIGSVAYSYIVSKQERS